MKWQILLTQLKPLSYSQNESISATRISQVRFTPWIPSLDNALGLGEALRTPTSPTGDAEGKSEALRSPVIPSKMAISLSIQLYRRCRRQERSECALLPIHTISDALGLGEALRTPVISSTKAIAPQLSHPKAAIALQLLHQRRRSHLNVSYICIGDRILICK